jgi:Zn-dependent peptidase ImmA (M78 family)
METVSVGGRRYSDPDVISLIRETGGLIDPRSAVLTQARRCLKIIKGFHNIPADPIARLRIVASVCGIADVASMNIAQQKTETTDAVLVEKISGERSIFYNPTRPRSRVAFSIAHEIAHTFFPSSARGARFRNICSTSSREANELERLCDLGASELLMPIDEFRAAAEGIYSLSRVQGLSQCFGSSFEATAFRLASAHPGIAVAGLLRYRLRLSELRQRKSAEQASLFNLPNKMNNKKSQPKYRRQSLHLSEACGSEYTIRWNKSFDPCSVVYKASVTDGVQVGIETLPNEVSKDGRLEAIKAPYQREDADPEFGDVLFFWSTD